MVAIVAFGPCLDIAAIGLDMDRKLDFNQELKTVGWSNVVSSLLGGWSYIFSHTIFTYRSKTNSRIVGVCVIIPEFAIVLAPVSVMSYVPRFFFDATLIFIAIDLMIEWLVLSYKTMSLPIGVGIILNFLLDYVRLPVVNRKPRSSGAGRTLTERRVLAEKRDAIAYFELSGFLFFGSSAQILDGVQKAVYVRRKLPDRPLGIPILATRTCHSLPTNTGPL
ncbi:Syntaxin-1A [Phytophthora pseudosyringae]|uniref:Syntaxin-1A n=1 Tax=Phytophthora pseudosyringae TaxID=221518 RepID=A0A8T1VLA3_9STRA|nr:Syntaxin-1A [Phytophthora pseudosyringae]